MGAQIDSDDGHAPLRITRSDSCAESRIGRRLPAPRSRPACFLPDCWRRAQRRSKSRIPRATTASSRCALSAPNWSARATAVSIRADRSFNPLDAYVPGDSSSAAFFLCAAAIFPESNLVHRRSAAESHAFGAARCAHRDGLPRLHAASRGAAWRTGRNHCARCRERAATL